MLVDMATSLNQNESIFATYFARSNAISEVQKEAWRFAGQSPRGKMDPDGHKSCVSIMYKLQHFRKGEWRVERR